MASYPPSITASETAESAEADFVATFDGGYGMLDPGSSFVELDGTGALRACILTVIDAPWPDTPAGPFIIELFVHPEARGRGVARALLRRARAALAAAGHARVGLRVDAGNAAALALYRAEGFVEWSGSRD